MRIGIACYPTYGGSGVVASELGRQLAARGHDVHILAYDLPVRIGCLHPRLRYHRTSVPEYPLFKYPPYTLAGACAIIRVAEEFELDIVHAHYAVPFSIAAYLAQEVSQRNFRIVTTLHGTDITLVGSDPGFFEMTRFGIEKSDAVTAVSGYLRTETYNTFKVRSEINVINNCVDHERFHPRENLTERRLFAGDEEKLILHVSNFRPVKNVPDVVKVFAKINHSMPSRLILIGDGPEMKVVKCMARKMDVIDRVAFLGLQSEIERIMPLADLFLLPSSEESFGLAALESIACGVPVIGTNTGGLPEIITDGADGFLCPTHDIDAMTAESLKLLRDEELHREFARRGREKVLEKFTPELIVPRYEELYKKTLESGTRERETQAVEFCHGAGKTADSKPVQ